MKKTTIFLAAMLAASAFGAFAQDAATLALEKPDPNGNLIGLTTENGRIAYDFIDLWFNKHQANEAWDKYVAQTGFINHAVYNATTADINKTTAQWKADEARAAGPGTVFDIKQVVAQGNLVFLHIAASHNDGVGAATGLPQGGAPAGGPPAGAAPGGAAPGGGAPPAAAQNGPGPVGDGKGPDEMVMILRVKNGKIVDHWDLHVPTNSNSVVFSYLD